MSELTEPTIAISLTVKNTADAIDFYTRAFNAVELFRLPMPDGGIAHAEFMIGNMKVYISDESADWHAYAVGEGASAPCLFAVWVEDCDVAFNQAVSAGGEAMREPEDLFLGVRAGMVRDPFGYRWNLRHVTEQLSQEEVMKRAKELMGG